MDDIPKIVVLTDEKISPDLLKQLCDAWFDDMVKIVVDIETGHVAIGGSMHADAESILIQNGSSQKNLWGANVYPDLPADQRIEYNALINIRPRDGNPEMKIQNPDVRERIKTFVEKLILAPDETLV